MKFAPEHVDLVAETLCAAYHADGRSEEGIFISPVWESISTRQRGDWRRAAQAIMRTISGNRHWLAADDYTLADRPAKGGQTPKADGAS